MGRPPKDSVTPTASQESIEATPVAENAPVAESDNLDDFMIKHCGVIGANIRYERKLRSFSIEDLAEFLELSPSYVGLLERGERCPSLKSLLKICQLFGATPNDLIMERTNITGSYKVAESRKSLSGNKMRTIESILKRLNDAELDFLITTMKGLKNLGRSSDNAE